MATLGDVLEKIVGGGTPSKSNPTYWGGDIPWATVKDMADNKFSLIDTKDHISEAGLKNSSSNLIPAGTVITSTRMGLGRAFINKVDVAINQDLKALIPNEKIDNRYLLWTIVNKRKYIESIGSGTTVKGIRLEQLRNIDIGDTPLEVQRKVAKVLGSYNNLVENNSKRIENLEAMARLLYRHYFDVSDATDWEKVKIGDILGKVPTSAKLQKSEYLDEGIYPVIDQGKEYIAGYTNKQEAIITDKLPLTVFGDHTRAVKLAQDPFARGADGTQIVVSDILPPYYLYQTIKDSPLSNEHYARHFKLLKATEIARPPEDILSEFESKVEPVFILINTLTKQNRSLAKARDMLLPRLMSGEIKL